MEYSSNTSATHPYGSQSGIKIALKDQGPTQVAAHKVSDNSVAVNERSVQATNKAYQIAFERKQLDEQEREKVVEQLNEFISSMNKSIVFKKDEDAGREVVSIFDVDTGELIRQIPDEELLEVLRRLRQQSSGQSTGLLIDKV
ncbi:flagellar protein FlaG [Vibrio agarivorans]|uniref:flagellar protein FlaG n=1 Tax=Vibrio agarivorans TaxID=153622 RepID=UPI0022301978|nr:flagellar protein FlaG [Vibrio agarivorans]